MATVMLQGQNDLYTCSQIKRNQCAQWRLVTYLIVSVHAVDQMPFNLDKSVLRFLLKKFVHELAVQVHGDLNLIS